MWSLAASAVLGDHRQVATPLRGDLLLAGVVAAQQLGGIDTGLDAPGELDLFGCGEQRRAADLVQVDTHQVGSRGDLVEIAGGNGVIVGSRGEVVKIASCDEVVVVSRRRCVGCAEVTSRSRSTSSVELRAGMGWCPLSGY